MIHIHLYRGDFGVTFKGDSNFIILFLDLVAQLSFIS